MVADLCHAMTGKKVTDVFCQPFTLLHPGVYVQKHYMCQTLPTMAGRESFRL